MPQSQWIIVIVAAGIALVVLARLFMVLGRKSGTEFPAAPPSGPVALPTAMPPQPETQEVPGLAALRGADRTFDMGKFLDGARTAYGLIVTAFEKGDREALKPLVSPDVLDGFSTAIAARGEAPQRFHFAAVKDAAIEQASVQDGLMEVTVRFDAVFETAEGVGAPHEITDHWTFTRAVRASDPNWTLVATSGEAA